MVVCLYLVLVSSMRVNTLSLSVSSACFNSIVYTYVHVSGSFRLFMYVILSTDLLIPVQIALEEQ